MSITEVINSNSRTQDVCAERMVIAYYMRNQGFTFKKIGEEINRDHSTVIHIINRCKDLISIRDKRVLDAMKSYQLFFGNPE